MSSETTTLELEALARIVDELDYYEILGLERTAPGPAVRQSYHAAQRRFHPDAHRSLPPDTREAVDRLARRIAEAYSVLRDPRRRRLYDERLATGDQATIRMPLVEANAEVGRRAADEHGARTPNGRRYWAMASADLAKGEIAAAVRNLQTAVTFEPDNVFLRERLLEARSRSVSR
jgi:curved DNA-binding protein CbpA